jgi:hypothetical protein
MSVPKACQRPGGSRPAASPINDFNLRTLRKYFIRHMQKPKCNQKHLFRGLVVLRVFNDGQTFIEQVQHIRLGHDAPQSMLIEQARTPICLPLPFAFILSKYQLVRITLRFEAPTTAFSPCLRARSHKAADMSVEQFTQN